MTTGSAASLPGPAPEVPLPPFHSFRRNGRLSVVPRVAAAGAPERQRFQPALADEPPRGRVLIVTDDAPLALDIQRILRGAGYLAVGPAASVADLERFVRRGPLDAAVLDADLAGGGAIVADRLSEGGVPVVWLTGASRDAIPRHHVFAPAIAKPVTGDELVATIERAIAAGSRPQRPGWYPVPPPTPLWPRVFPQL
ncbi:MAG: hypothetical protein KIT25_22110 [Enhydrobacter sp.]|nr:MAG: hypothetical protein KIT25_22110 [Enhydrobacter sp.]